VTETLPLHQIHRVTDAECETCARYSMTRTSRTTYLSLIGIMPVILVKVLGFSASPCPESVRRFSPVSRPSPSGGLRPALTSAAGRRGMAAVGDAEEKRVMMRPARGW